MLATTYGAEKGWKLPAETARLQSGPGAAIVTAQCITCHSVDYITTQPVMTRAAWTAIVTKMKEKYGAPIAAEHVEAVVNYLATTYGAERKKPEQK
jgi:sulfite dehydrogenase (cytochrome) subunit B